MVPEKLNKILNDNVSGSAELVKKLAEFFLEETNAKRPIEKYFPVAEEKLREFAAVKSLTDSLKNSSVENYRKILTNFIEGETEVYERIFEKASEKFFDGIKIITISNSRTLTEIFKLAGKRFSDVSVFVSESRPVNEGTIMAETLAEAGINVTLITEAMIPEYTRLCDAAFIGADKILANGSCVNKIGSKIIALACKYYGKPFYVFASRDKFADENDFERKARNSNEIFGGSGKFEIAPNYYFEAIEKDLISEIITD